MADIQNNLSDYMRLYLVLETDYVSLPLGDFIMQVVEGGVTAIQLRDKGHNAAKRYDTARQIASLLKGKDILFIINNTADIALAVDAHGVHVGPEDLPVFAIKQAFPSLICGSSCNSIIDINDAYSDNADYIGIGPVFFTQTKSNLRPVLGVEDAQKLAEASALPSVAIGGINADNISKVAGGKFSGIALSSFLCSSKQPYDDALFLRQKIDFLAGKSLNERI